ncbi:hypothetical protein OIO90_001799 [Microbotryomycetes sp. JL221]|nr:hypothetical protein OIO90_001799 [Microbotryomycetes sp. JL221]
MSRQDQLVEAFDNTLTNLRRELSSRLNSTPTPATSASSATTLRSALQNLLDSPNTTTATLSSSSSSSSASRLTTTPFASSSHQVLPVELAHPHPPAQQVATMTQPQHSRIDDDNNHHNQQDELPAYTRRAANVTNAARTRLPQTRLHVYTSKSRKMQLQMIARGEDHVILTQTEPLESVKLKGNLTVCLNQPEAVTFVKIRLKGIVQTQVAKSSTGAAASGRQSILDEVTIWEHNIMLWDGQSFLPSNESLDSSKLQGTFTFPFELSMPGQIKYPLTTTKSSSSSSNVNEVETKMRLPPPSFVLASQSDEAYSKGSEWASCRYYVKVTLGRKGFLKVNERFVVPVIYVPRHSEPEMSAMRTVAVAQGLPTPGPTEDPSGWKGKRARQQIKKGLFGKASGYEVVLLLPSPATFPRMSVIPFAIKISSSDSNLNERFPVSSIKVYLVQRAHVCAQGLVNIHDKIVATGIVQQHDSSQNTPSTVDEPLDKRFKGMIALNRSVGSSFKAPNLSVSFLVVVSINVNGLSNKTDITMPCNIVSSTLTVSTHSRTSSRPESRSSNHSIPFPISQPSLRPHSNDPSSSSSFNNTNSSEIQQQQEEQGQGLSFSNDFELPPSYFQVVEQDRSRS